MGKHVLLLRYCAFLMNCGIFLVSVNSDSWTTSITLANAFVVSTSISFLAMILDRQRGGVSYMFEFFLLFFVALPAAVQISANVFPWYAMLNPQHVCWTFSILAASHIAYLVGLIWQDNRHSASTISAHSAHPPHQSPPYRTAGETSLAIAEAVFYTKWAWIFALVAVAFAVLAGPSNLFVARMERGETPYRGLTEQLLFMSRSLSLLAMTMLIYIVKFSQRSRLRQQNIIALALFALPFLAINYLPALPRFVLFGMFLALSTAFVDYFDPKKKGLVAIASTVMLFIFFPIIKSLGAGELDLSGAGQRFSFHVIYEYLLRVDFDAFMQIASTVEYYSNDIGPIRYGANFLGVVLFFVPRGIWSGKPIDTGEIVSTGLGYWYTNVSSPLQAEALMAFGLAGPLLVFLAMAVFISRVEQKAKFSAHRIPQASSFFIYAMSMGFIVIVLRGALNGVAPQFATAFLAFFVMQQSKKIKQIHYRS